MQQNLRYLFVSVLLLLLNDSIYTAAQQNVTLKDLPECAITCADIAAASVKCNTEDTSCLCSHPDFTATTVQCSRSTCTAPDALGLTQTLLSTMCSSVTTSTTDSRTTTSATSTSSTTGQSSSSTTTSSTTSTSTSSTSQSSSTSTTSSTTVATSTPSTTQSASSTVVVVKTVVVATATPTSAAGRLDIRSISMGTRALAILIFSLPSLSFFAAAI